ncbi:MAG: hypothetical protein SFZ02_20980 [bacterium]|nr:hypothetical protein [bacterium]
MQTFPKYARGLWKTIVVLVRGGGKPPEEANIPYRRWTERTNALVTAVFAVADKEAISVATRESLKIKVDGREMSLQTLLQAIAYHAKEEYAYLLKNFTDNSLMTIQATNLNDEYALSRFIEAELIKSEAVLKALTNLHTHLKQVPNKN